MIHAAQASVSPARIPYGSVDKYKPNFGSNPLVDSFSNGAGIGTGVILGLGGLALTLNVLGDAIETTRSLIDKTVFRNLGWFKKPNTPNANQ